MARVVGFIDGFNLYHSINDQCKDRDWNYRAAKYLRPARPHFKQYKWLNLKELVNQFISKTEDTLIDVYYFTTVAEWDKNKSSKHNTYLKALKTTGIKPVFGNFQHKDKICKSCNASFKTPIEKKTDVNISVFMLQGAMLDWYDKALLISGDTDLTPAVAAVSNLFPKKIVGVISPMDRKNEELRKAAQFRFSITEDNLKHSKFPEEVNLGDGIKLKCPTDWIYSPPS